MSILDEEKKIKEGVIKPEAENESTAETAAENENTPSPETPAETTAGSAETVTSTEAQRTGEGGCLCDKWNFLSGAKDKLLAEMADSFSILDTKYILSIHCY